MFTIHTDFYETISCGIIALNKHDSTCVFANTVAKNIVQIKDIKYLTWLDILNTSKSELVSHTSPKVYQLPSGIFYRVSEQSFQSDYEILTLIDCTTEFQYKNELIEFCYIASHDLQEPLRKIDTFGSRLLKVSDSFPSEATDYLSRIQSATGRLQIMLDGLLRYSRINQDTEFTPKLYLTTLFKKSIDIAKQNNVKLKIELPETGPIKLANNLVQLEFLFHEIISNAIKFGATVITVNCHIFSDLTIAIQDNGIGMKEIDSSKIFKLFTKLNSRSQYQGAGLGLAICQKIVENHKGSIQVQSTEGFGSLFIISIPFSS